MLYTHVYTYVCIMSYSLGQAIGSIHLSLYQICPCGQKQPSAHPP